MKTLKQILLETAGELKFSGILKLNPDTNTLVSLKKLTEDLPPDANPLPEETIHVTLVHQNCLKQYRKEVENMDLNDIPPPKVVITDKIYKIEREKRISWVSILANQEEMQAYVDQFMQIIGAPPHPEDRVYHITLANSTGNPKDSVGNVKKSDIVGSNLVSNVLQDSENVV